MASGVAYFSTNTDLGLVNALNQSLNLYLPLNAPNGKSLFIKDATGNSFKSTITVLTQGADTFEDGSVQQFINTPYESIQLAYNTNKWYITGGTMFNTLNISTLRSQAISTISISSLTASFSTLRTVDQRLQSTVGTINSVSSLLYYNSTIISAGLRFAPSQVLNRYTSGGFKPTQVSGIAMWLDAADPLGTGTPPSNGSALSTWFDKSGNGRNFTAISGSPTYLSPLLGVFINGATLDIMRSPSLTYTSGVTSLFVVVKITAVNNGYDYILVFGDNTSDSSLRYNGGVTFNGNDIFNGTIWYSNGTSGLTLIPTTVFNTTTLIDGVINATNTTVLQLSSSFNGRYLTGNVQEVILYNSVISDNNRQLIEAYFSWKWNIQANLSVNNPYRSFAPTNIY